MKASIIAATCGFLLLMIGSMYWEPLIFGIFIIPVLGAVLGKPDKYGFMILILGPIVLSRHYAPYFSFIEPDVIRIALIGMALLMALLKLRDQSENINVILPWGGLFLVAVLTAPYLSAYPSVSIQKALFVGSFLIFMLWGAEIKKEISYTIVSFVCALSIANVLCYFVKPAIGFAYSEYLSGDSGYSGLLSHAQLMAAFMGLCSAIILHLILHYRGFAWRAFMVGVYLLTCLSVYLSSSRIGALTLFVSSLSYLACEAFLSSDFDIKKNARFAMGILITASVTASFAMLPEVLAFIEKGGDKYGGISTSGRVDIIYASWQGFLDSPLIGKGFQVPSEFAPAGRSGFVEGSTSIEKSFAGTMILEEVGLVGAALFSIGLVNLLLNLRRRESVLAISLIVGFGIINIAEATVFSPSSLGGLCWITIFSSFGASSSRAI